MLPLAKQLICFMLSHAKQLICAAEWKLRDRSSTLRKTDEHLAASVRVNDAVLQSQAGFGSALGGTMHEFRMDSTGSPVPFDSLASSHYARHGLSRRAFIGGAAAATGATLGSGLLSPAVGLAGSHSHPAPKPTTGVTTIEGIDFHFTIFGPGVDPSSITDFKGSVGVAQVQGTGTARKPDGRAETLLFDTDMRFMKGIYLGKDGTVHRGTFGFV
jgi:hypothetical protein